MNQLMILTNNIALTWLLKRRLSQESSLVLNKDKMFEDPNESARISLSKQVLYIQFPVEIVVLCMFLVLIWNGTSEKKMYSPKVIFLMTAVSIVDISVHGYSCYLVHGVKSYKAGTVWNKPQIILISTCSVCLFNQLSFYFYYIIQSNRKNFLSQISLFFVRNSSQNAEKLTIE